MIERLLGWTRLLGPALVTSLFLSGGAIAGGAPERSQSQLAELREGDILIHQSDDGWSALKVIATDRFPDGSTTVHCILYKPVGPKPDLSSVARMDVLAAHAPIDSGGFHGWERIGSLPVAQSERSGFVEYLRQTNFRQYIEVTGKDINQVIADANRHYNSANALGDTGHRIEAIAEYDKAVELFPLFYEAIDNRGFTRMELGDYQAALADFEQSLLVNPDGFRAFFSKGECLMKLGKLDAAESIFIQGQKRFPTQHALFAQILDRLNAMRVGQP